MQNYPKIAIVYLSFHCEPYIDDVVSSLKKLTYPKDRIEFIVVDNPHPQYGSSVQFLEENVMPLSAKEIPHTTLLIQKENLGFAGGNNVGVEWAIANNFDYVYFHNNDGFMAANCLEPLVETMENDKTIGASQSLMLLHPETDLINSTGNAFHYLGFGFCNEYRMKIKDVSLPPVKEICYASGAAFMISVDMIKKYGSWDKDFFLYHEDLEWSLRLRMVGYKVVMVSNSVFYHKYQFARSITKFFWMERNRYGVMLMFLKLPTLLLLLPIGIPLELGLWLFAFKGGWAQEKVKVYKYWMNSQNWALWLQKRKYIQHIRKISDRTLLKQAVSKIEFQDASTDNPMVHYVANPIMTLYYKIVVRGFIWW